MAYVKHFSPRFATEKPGISIKVPPEPEVSFVIEIPYKNRTIYEIACSFANENAGADLHEVRILEKGAPPFDWAIAVAGNKGRFEVLLLDQANHRHSFLGTNFRKGVRTACYAIRGVASVHWEK